MSARRFYCLGGKEGVRFGSEEVAVESRRSQYTATLRLPDLETSSRAIKLAMRTTNAANEQKKNGVGEE